MDLLVPAKMRRVIAASMIGTIVEWYDLFLFSTGAIFISKVFFTTSNPLVAVIDTLLIYALGFLTRPLGALVFGRYGDKISRKGALILTLVISGTASGLIGLVPGTGSIGFLAIVILAVLRLVGGFGFGGEWGGAMLLTLENVKGKRGFYSAFVQSTVGIGLLLGAGSFLVLGTLLPTSAMIAYGWRIPFLISFVLVLIGLAIRLSVSEPLIYSIAKQAKKIPASPILNLFRRHGLTEILSIIIVGAIGNIYIVGATLLPIYFEIHKIVTVTFAQYGLIGLALADISFNFIGGAVSDRFGRKPVIFAAFILFLIFAFPAFVFATPALYILAAVVFGVLHGFSYSPLAGLISELFPTGIRYTGSSVAYQFGNAFISGWTPLIALAVGGYGDVLLLLMFPLIFNFIGIGSLRGVSETKDVSLESAAETGPEGS